MRGCAPRPREMRGVVGGLVRAKAPTNLAWHPSAWANAETGAMSVIVHAHKEGPSQKRDNVSFLRWTQRTYRTCPAARSSVGRATSAGFVPPLPQHKTFPPEDFLHVGKQKSLWGRDRGGAWGSYRFWSARCGQVHGVRVPHPPRRRQMR